MLKIHINHLFSDLKPENKNRNRVMTQNVVREENFRTAVACSTVRVLKKKIIIKKCTTCSYKEWNSFQGRNDSCSIISVDPEMFSMSLLQKKAASHSTICMCSMGPTSHSTPDDLCCQPQCSTGSTDKQQFRMAKYGKIGILYFSFVV